jgi:hypothetical protein
MIELHLTRTSGDRRLYRLEGVGTVRMGGFFSRSAIAEAGESRWQFSRRGFWQRVLEATDPDGVVVGEFAPRDFRRGGALLWRGRELALRPISTLREQYVLRDGGHELARVEGKSWGRRPVRVSLPRPDALEPGLLLFTIFVVRQLAINAANSSSAGTTAAVSSTAG